MVDRLEAMSIILLTIEKGSLTGAAKALNMPLPTVSRKISELESYLGVRLIQRSTRKLALTDAGIGYVAASRRILEDIGEAERAASGEYMEPRGELVLTAPALFGHLHILPIVTDFLAAYPDINIRLMLSNQVFDLLDERIDMAVRIGVLSDSSMIATRVGDMATLICAPPELLTARGVPATPADLRALPCVSFTGPAIQSWSFRDPATRTIFEIPIVPRLTITLGASVVEAAVRCGAATRVPHYQCADALRTGRLVRILRDYEKAPVPVHLIHASRGTMPLKMRTFLDFATGRLRADLSAMTGTDAVVEMTEPRRSKA